MRVLLHGAKGVMGQNVQEVAKDVEGLRIVAGLDQHTDLTYAIFYRNYFELPLKSFMKMALISRLWKHITVEKRMLPAEQP